MSKSVNSLVRVKSRVFPGRTYLTRGVNLPLKKKKVKLPDASSLGVTHIIDGIYKGKSKKGNSFIIEYINQYGETENISLTQMRQLRIIPRNITIEKFYEKEERIRRYFSNERLEFLQHTIKDMYLTPEIVVDTIKDYIDNYKITKQLSKKYFLQLVREYSVIRHDILKNLESINRVNEILKGYGAKPSELIQIRKNPKSMPNKKKKAPYGATKEIVLTLAHDLNLKIKDTPINDEVLSIIKILKYQHGIDMTEPSLRKILQRGNYADIKPKKNK